MPVLARIFTKVRGNRTVIEGLRPHFGLMSTAMLNWLLLKLKLDVSSARCWVWSKPAPSALKVGQRSPEQLTPLPVWLKSNWSGAWP
ncbi:MAG: hypothetical protein R2932_29705 [Caldilineaceae bacterium]